MPELYGAMKWALGKDFPLEAVMSVSEPGKNGWTVADTIEFARLAQGTIDILHLRGGIADPQHPTGFTSTEDNQMPYLEEIGQVKKACVEQGGWITILNDEEIYEEGGATIKLPSRIG